jgi:hypothetical protein
MKRLLALGTASAVLLLGAGCTSGSPHSSNNHESGSSSTTTSPTTTPTTTTVPTSVPSSSSTTLFGSTNVKGNRVLSQQGEGNVVSNVFTIPDGSKWDLAWSYQCSGAVSGGLAFSNVIFIVYKGDSIDRKDAVASGAAASLQGTQHYSDSGDFTIHVSARLGCTWSMKAIILSG